MASPGMMQSGLSRQLFEAWCTDKRNGVLIAGYCVEGTLAKVRERERENCVWQTILLSGEWFGSECFMIFSWLIKIACERIHLSKL